MGTNMDPNPSPKNGPQGGENNERSGARVKIDDDQQQVLYIALVEFGALSRAGSALCSV